MGWPRNVDVTPSAARCCTRGNCTCEPMNRGGHSSPTQLRLDEAPSRFAHPRPPHALKAMNTVKPFVVRIGWILSVLFCLPLATAAETPESGAVTGTVSNAATQN